VLLLDPCPVCGQANHKLPIDIGAEYPDPYVHLTSELKDSIGWISAKENPDFCRIKYDDGQTDHFIRGVLELPILGADIGLRLGVWTSLSEANWDFARETWREPRLTRDEPMFGWLCTGYSIYPGTEELACSVYLSAELRPQVRLHDADHPFVVDQQRGITRPRLAEIVHSALPDFDYGGGP
jgi:hypothetical protein